MDITAGFVGVGALDDPRQGVGYNTTPVIHGTSDTRVQAPHPTEAWICFALVGIEKKRIGRSKPLPYKGFYLLRDWMT